MIDPSANGGTVNIVDANAASSTPLQAIAGTNGSEAGAGATFTVKLAGVATSAWPVTVGYRVSGTATSGVDYRGIGTITIPSNTNSVTVNLDVLDDQVIEPTETMTFTLLSGSATDGGGNAFIFPPDPVNTAITVNIADNDAIAANQVLSVVNNIDAAEPSSSGAYTVSLPAGYTSSANITLSYTMTGGATRNTDYTVFTITLPAYQNSVAIRVNVNDDKIIEGTETTVLNLAGGTDGNSFTYTANAAANTASLDIADDDLDPANMVLTVTNDGDAAEPTGNGGFMISLPTGITVSEDVTVNYTIGGTATAGGDYAAIPGVITLPAGQSRVIVPVTVADDQVIEATETVIMTLTGGSSTSFGFTGTGSATVAITDDESSTSLSLSVSNAADAAEPGTDGGFTISLPTGITATEDVTVNYSVSGAATAGDDYVAITSGITIPAGLNSVTVPVTITDDQVIEVTETVVMTLAGGSSNNFTFTGTGSATVYIADDESDDPTNRALAISKDGDGAEPGTDGGFTISLSEGITASEAITVSVTTVGSATAGEDYVALTGTAVIPVGGSSVSLPVAVLDDQLIEGTENLVITLNGGTSTSFTFTGAGSTTVELTDDDNVPENLVLNVTKTADAAEPSTNGGFHIALPAGLTATEAITVNYSVAGTAVGGQDYIQLSGETVIPAGDNGVDLPLTVADDQVIESAETVMVGVTGGSSTSFTFTGGSSATLDIADDDNIPENLAVSIRKTADGAEPGTDGGFTVSLPAGVTVAEDITVDYTISGTATSGDDYTALAGAVIIPAEQNSVSIPVTVTNDNILEVPETVIVTLTGGASDNFSFTAIGNAAVNIADDESADPANLVLAISKDADAAEAGTDGGFTISLPSGITVSEDITVTYSISGTAAEGTDYTALTGTAVIPAGQGAVSIPVEVRDDQLIEQTETVIVTLTGGSSDNFTFTGTGGATVEIADDESADPANRVLTVTNDGDAAEPTSNGGFTISLPAGIAVSEDVTVVYAISGTAAAGDDYIAITGAITIPAGQNRVTVPVTVTDDQVIEAMETVVMTLVGGSSKNFTFIGTGSTTVDIADDEGAVPANLELSIGKAADGAEPGTDGGFTISLPAGIAVSEDVTVVYAISGTAAAGDDYIAITSAITIPAGQNRVAVPVTVTDDQVIEVTETLVITLAGGSSASFTFTGEGSATVDITDDESADPANLKLVISKDADAVEAGTNGGFTISLPAGITVSEDVTVTYTVDGTAMAGDDYAALTGTAVIPADRNGVAIPVAVVDDQVIEPTETVIATLAGGSSVSFAFTGADSATVDITDDESADPANLVLAISKDADAAEGGTDGGFTISLPAGITVSEDITVTYSIGGTAAEGTDYTALTGTVVIPAGQGAVSIPVEVRDDQLIEQTETVIVTLTGGSSDNFTFTGTGSATVDIADDESADPANRILTVTNDGDAAEPTGNGGFTISLPAGIAVSEDVTVVYAISGTTAAGDDYIAITGAITIPAGQNRVAVPVTVTDDQVIEATETVMITLAGGSSANFTFTGTGSATVNITDDESTVPANLELTINKTADAAEPGTDGGFTISLPTGITASEGVTVTYTIGGTATVGDDYAALSGTAVIKTGDNSVMVRVTILDDDLSEPVETVIVTLSEASALDIPVTIGTSNSATIDIADDDERIPDLAVTISVDNALPMAGERVVFTIGVTNLGPDDATGVEMLDKLPSGYAFVSAEIPAGSYDGESGVWAVGNLAVGESRTLRITAVVNGEGDYVNRAEVRGNEDDPDADNNESEASVSPVHPPRTVADAGTGYANKAIVIPVLANDAPGTHPLDAGSVEIVTRPQRGTVSISTDGTVTYTSGRGYVGGDQFSYRVKDSEGNWSEPAEVSVTVAANPLRIPNIFTPNGDGQNDRFEIEGIEGFDKAEVVVFNRWGNEIYRHNDYDNTWDGAAIPDGTYYYMLTLHNGSMRQVEKGWIVLKKR